MLPIFRLGEAEYRQEVLGVKWEWEVVVGGSGNIGGVKGIQGALEKYKQLGEKWYIIHWGCIKIYEYVKIRINTYLYFYNYTHNYTWLT